MKHTQAITQINREQFLKITPETTWQELSDAESQTIKAGHGVTVLAWARVDGVSPSPVLSLAT